MTHDKHNTVSHYYFKIELRHDKHNTVRYLLFKMEL